jgi:hypothetical protein
MVKSYTVHQPPSPPAERIDRAEALVFVKDGFSLFAFLIAPVWMLVNRMWLVLFIYVVLFAALRMILMAFGAPEPIANAVFFGLNLLVAFEADSLRRWTLERRGFVLIGTVTGDSYDVCQRRFFESWLPTVPAVEATEFAGGLGAPLSDPYRAAVATPQSSNLGTVVEPKPKRGLFGGWRSK